MPTRGQAPVSRVKLGRNSRVTLSRDIREAAKLEVGDYLDAEVTQGGAILLRPVGTAGREPTSEQEAEILAAVNDVRAQHAADRRR